MTTLADVIVGGASGTPERLGVPTGASFVQGAITTGQNTSIGFKQSERSRKLSGGVLSLC